LRFARITRISPKLALTACVAVLSALSAGGCTETFGHIENDWFNPGSVGRFKKQPLLMPIVNSLDTGVEEPNDQFASASDPKPEDTVASNQDYVIGKNDTLSISITDLVAPGVETVKQTRVSESGNISLPLIPPVKAEGLTEAQLEIEIARAYREANLMPNAQVSVTVAQGLARTFSILGSVQRPSLYAITQSDFRILDALVTAGDINSQGVDYLYIIRKEGPAGATTNTAAPMPGGMAPAPASTQPNDVLTPRSQANQPKDLKPVALLMQNAAAPSAAPAAAPAAAQEAPASAPAGEGRYITIDGKSVLVGNQPATAGQEGAAPAVPAPTATPAAEQTPGTPPTANTAMAPTAAPSSQPFEFTGPNVNGQRIIRVPVQQLKNGDLRYNIVIRPQDMIIVPPPTTGEYYMDGHINRGGVYSLTARQITLKQAVAAAGGFDQLSTPAKTDIIRRIGQDREVFARVDLDKVFSGLQPDIYLKPNDIVRVGTNAFQPFIASFRNAFRITYGFGFLYDRNYAPDNTNN
jgi:protein involved in polysaccharide export with SLBB domain